MSFLLAVISEKIPQNCESDRDFRVLRKHEPPTQIFSISELDILGDAYFRETNTWHATTSDRELCLCAVIRDMRLRQGLAF